MRLAATCATALLLALGMVLLAAPPAEARARYVLASALPNSGLTRIFVDTFLAEMRRRAPAITIEPALDGRLGGEAELVDQLKAGEHELHLGVLHGAIHYPELDATLVPYLFPDYPSVERFLAGPVGRRMAEALARRGQAVQLGTWDMGQRWTTSTKRFETVEELHDIKIRMPEIPLWIKVWGGMGAAVAPIAAPDVPAALRQGTVDAQENVLSNILGRRMYETQPFLIETAHQQAYVSVLAHKGFWQKQPPEMRRQMQEAVDRATDAATDAVRSENAAILERLLAAGMTRVQPAPGFRRKAELVIEKAARDTLAPGIYEAALAAIEGR